jgi:hypothetical protein
VTQAELQERLARLVEQAKRADAPADRARIEAQLDFLTSEPIISDGHIKTLTVLNRRLADVVRRLEAVAAMKEED